MAKINDNIENIIPKIFAGEATLEEQETVRYWIEENKDNRNLFLQLKNIWDVSQPAFDPNEIDSEVAYDKVAYQLFNPKTKHGILFYWQKIAAVIAIPLILFSGYVGFNLLNSEEPAEVYQEIFTPYGNRSRINLPDRSVVWLNAGSSLKYPVQFSGKERKVFLTGEAYFEVKSNNKNPFIVRTGEMDIKALGTEFNVKAYENDSITAVTLVNGNVRVTFDEKEALLMPGKKIDVNRNSSEYAIAETDTYKWCSWKDGIYAFRNDPLEDVFHRLGQIYNIEFIVKDKEVAQYIYRATFEDESLDQILNLLKISAPIKYKRSKYEKEADNYYHKQVIEVYKANK